jgi:hypothetical protein
MDYNIDIIHLEIIVVKSELQQIEAFNCRQELEKHVRTCIAGLRPAGL